MGCSQRAGALGTSVGGVALLLWLMLQAEGCSSGPGLADASPDAGPDGGAASLCLPLDAGVPKVTAWTGVDAGPLWLPEDYLAGYYAAFCDGMSRCFPFESYLIPNCVEQLEATGLWLPPTLCGVTAPGFFGCEWETFDLTALSASVSAVGGFRLSYDPNAAAACLAAPWTVCMERYNQVIVPLACGAVFGPLVADGGVCDSNLECVSGNCSELNGACSGTCAPPSPPTTPTGPFAGSGCGLLGGDCGVDAGLTCDGQFCRGDGGVGAACSPNFYGYDECVEGLFCEPRSLTCQPQIQQGGACVTGWFNVFSSDISARCGIGLVCAGEGLLLDGGARPGACQPASGFGEPCTPIAPDEAQHTTGCMLGGVCSCGICVPPPTSGACANAPTPCLPDVAACDFADSGTCLPLSSFPSCTNNQQCTSGYCDTPSGSCTDAPLLSSCSP